jgi:hypothetical protein
MSFMYHVLDKKISMEVNIDNMTLSEIESGNASPLLKFLSVNPKAKPQALKCSYDKVDRQGIVTCN